MKKIFFILTFTLLLFNSSTLISRAECDMSDLDQKISCLSAKVTSLQDQAQTLFGQIAYYDSQIVLNTLKISQTEAQINTISQKIDQLELTLRSRANLLENQIVQTYKKGPIDPLQILFSDSGVSQIISRFKYLQLVQANNRKILYDTQTVQTNYAQQKTLIQDSKKKLDAQKKNLASIRAERDNLLKQTQNSEANYQKLLAQAKAQLAAFSKFTSGASILTNQTKCDSWGCYYNQRDALWGNMRLGDTGYTVASSGCFITSISMWASHFGKNIKPSDIAANANAFTATGNANWDFSVNGVSISISSVPKSSLDSQLATGKAVLAGLYGGPDHWIVILKKDGDKYIMHDPDLENGGNRPLSDKYSLSNITALRIVNFN